jgi:hypothetical protein
MVGGIADSAHRRLLLRESDRKPQSAGQMAGGLSKMSKTRLRIGDNVQDPISKRVGTVVADYHDIPSLHGTIVCVQWDDMPLDCSPLAVYVGDMEKVGYGRAARLHPHS